MKRRRRADIAGLRTRLTRLRETASWLTNHAGIGGELRLILAAHGSPSWPPAEDLSWRSWVERHGDDEALGLVAAIDELLEEMLARAEAGGGTT